MRSSGRKKKRKGNKTYSQVQFALDRPLTPEEYALIKPLTEQVAGYSATSRVVENAAGIDIIVDEETGEVIEPLN